MRACDQPQDLDNFVVLLKSFSGLEMKQEVAVFGCLLHNCAEYYWSLVAEHFVDYKELEIYQPKTSMLQFEFQKSGSSFTTREVVSYTLTNFVADIGGYLGLLLGASILSIYDYIILVVRKLFLQE